MWVKKGYQDHLIQLHDTQWNWDPQKGSDLSSMLEEKIELEAQCPDTQYFYKNMLVSVCVLFDSQQTGF